MLHLHNYQTDIKRRLAEAWRDNRSVMVQMPTGTGKTHVLAAIVNEELEKKEGGAKGIWIVAHRRELVAQIEETLGRYGIGLGNGHIRVVSIQWLSRHWEDVEEVPSLVKDDVEDKPSLVKVEDKPSLVKEELNDMLSQMIGDMKGTPSLVIIDEAHHAVAETYRAMWTKWPDARFLGLTATPCRMNRRGFTDLFDTLITSWTVAEFIRKGFLSAFDYVSIRQGSAEQRLIDSLEKRGADGDYQVTEMNRVLNGRPSIERLYRSVEEFAGDRKGIVYAISIDHARHIATYYNNMGLSAAAIDSRTPAAERRRLVEDFKAGRIRVLVNVDIFSEGFDCPDVGFVQMARPTLSLAKYLQQVGRGLRKTKDKETCVLIDNVGLHRQFGLPVAAWDWEAMFRGVVAGKARPFSKNAETWSCVASERRTVCPALVCDMEVVVSHEQLMNAINNVRQHDGTTGGRWHNSVNNGRQSDGMYSITDNGSQPVGTYNSNMLHDAPNDGQRLGGTDNNGIYGQIYSVPSLQTDDVQALLSWQDRESGLWGLRRGGCLTAAARFAGVFDTTADVAAVRFADGSCGLVREDGETIWQTDGCRSMRFMKDGLLHVVAYDNKDSYVDLFSLRTYGQKPRVRTYGTVGLLEVGGVYYSRTRTVYVNGQKDSGRFIRWRKFYLSVYDTKMPFPSYHKENQPAERYSGFACILDGDRGGYYWLYYKLADGSIIVMNNAREYYHVAERQPRKYIGCRRSEEEWRICRVEIERLARLAETSWHALQTERAERRRRLLARSDAATPFQSGTKWGLKVGDRVTVPPIYRNIKSPVGKYCAVEMNYSQWGVVALDGTIMVAPHYSDIEISKKGIVTATKTTGSKMSVKLP